jgi:capsular polysaccharide biosynthesis protein
MEESDGFDFDLGKYIEILLRQWMLILAAILVCTIAAGIVNLRKPVTYEARVLVASAKLGSTVSFGSTIVTLSEGQGYTNIVDRRARLLSFIALVKSPIIAQRVFDDLQDDFGERMPQPSTLVDMVQGSLLSGSDSIEIVVNNGSPELALAIANTWGYRFVEYINDLYSTGGSPSANASIQAQIDEAYKAYTAAQETYVTFLSASPLDEYTRMVEEFLRVDRLLQDSRSLRDQVIAGGEDSAASNGLVLSLLKAQAFAATPGLENVQLQLSPGESDLQAVITDVESLVTALEDRYDVLEERIVLAATSGGLEATGSGSSIAANSSSEVSGSGVSQSDLQQSTAEQQIRFLLAQIENETGRKDQSLLARDLAWQTYSNLATKEVELAVAAQVGGYEVVLGSPAIESQKINNSTQPIFLATMVGLVIGVFSAFGIEYWWGYKGIEAQPVLLFGGRKRGDV